MAGAADVTVRVQSLDGTWEVLGADRARGIVPEGISYSHDAWGSASASFTLKRDPGVPWPDLSAFTPVDIHVGGVKTWSGRITQTPTTDSPDARQVSVQCSGWQYHLDDDAYEGKYVHTSLAAWRDIYGDINVTLSNYSSAMTVGAGAGVITFAIANGNTLPAGGKGGVFLDLGPSNYAKRVVVTYQGGSSGTFDLKLHGGADINTSTESYTLASTPLATTSTTVAQSFSSSFRYIRLEASNAGAVTGGDQAWARITAIQVFAATAYESGNTSILKTHHVVTDALTRAPLLSTDTSAISTASTFSIPDYAPDGYRTPREHIAAVNAYENYQAYVDVDQRLVYASRDTSPTVEVGAWAGVTFEDASTNSAQDIYNRVIVEGTGPDESTLRAERITTTSGASWRRVVAPAPLATSASSTGPIRTAPSPASIGFGGNAIFEAGVTYRLNLQAGGSVSGTGSDSISGPTLTFGTSGDYATKTAAGSFSFLTTALDIALDWTPAADAPASSVFVTITETGGGTGSRVYTVHLQDLVVSVQTTSIVTRRRFMRTMILPVSSAMTSPGANKLGDTYLANHTTTPLKGSLKITGPNGVRRVLGGASVHPSQLGLLTNQVIRLAHRIDFDTGGVGKDGTIVSVSYDHGSQSASVEVDNSSSNFEALLSRLAVNVGQLS